MDNESKKILFKSQFPTVFLENEMGTPNIVLIMPITRNVRNNESKWQAAIDFVENSEIKTFIVVDKTRDSVATEYFMENFNLTDKNLLILPRSICESHYESLGSIKLDKNLWVMQLHDDDMWEGNIKLPEIVDPNSIYYSRFIIRNPYDIYKEEKDFTYPARINFALTPSHIWNKFADIVRDQQYHVAGSMDSTLNLMAQLTCQFKPIQNFQYIYDNHNWASRRASKKSLLQLTEKDGWESWTSIEIALLSRQLDNLSCLIYIEDLIEKGALKMACSNLMENLKPRATKRLFIRVKILKLKARIRIRNLSLKTQSIDPCSDVLVNKLNRITFIRDLWTAKELKEVIDLVVKLRRYEILTKLNGRFQFWHSALSNLNKSIGA